MTMLRSGGWILLVWLAAPAAAQDVGPFDQLVGLVEPGDGVRVTFSGGREGRARVVAVTPETLSVVTHGQHRDLGKDDVWFIHRRVRDPTRNGAWVGFASGAAAGLWYLHGFCFSGSDSCTPQPRVKDFALIGGFFGAVGAWLGVGLDGLIAREEELWPQTPSRAWSVTPLLTPDRRGVAVSLSF